MKDEILKELKKEGENPSLVYLSTKIVPEEILSEVLEKSEITNRNFELYELFPEKTGTYITHRPGYKKVEVIICGEKK